MSEPGAAPASAPRVVPHLVVSGAARAIDFYAAAFGAEEIMRMPAPGGLLMHAEIRIGESHVLLCDEMPGTEGCRAPSALEGTSVTLHLVTGDADASFARAVAAGATPVTPVEETFWGDRYGVVADPFGHRWSMSTRVRELSPAQIAMRARAFFAAS